MYITVSIRVGLKFILGWSMFDASEADTFTSMLEKLILDHTLTDEALSQYQPACSIRESKDTVSDVAVQVGFNVVLCCQLNGRFVQYVYPQEKRSKQASGSSPINAFSILMSAAREQRLPRKLLAKDAENGRSDYKLHDDIIDFLATKKLGFSAGCEMTSGKQVVSTLQHSLFYLLPHLPTLKSRNQSFLPDYFVPFTEKTYSDTKAHKHSLPPLDRKKLVSLCREMYGTLSLPCMSEQSWKTFSSSLYSLAKNVDNYIEYLQQKLIEMQKTHHEPTPLRTPVDGNSSNVRCVAEAKVRPPRLIARYKDLESALLAEEMYGEPIFVNDFAPSSPRFRYTYIHEINLPFTVELYSYHHGNNVGTLWYVWKVPAECEQRDVGQSKKVIDHIEKNIPVYHTREMKRVFSRRYGLLCNAKPSVILDMYKFLTGDNSATTTSEETQKRLQLILESQDPEVILDLRSVNPGRHEKYSAFWDGVSCLLNENALKAVDSRRHGTVCHLAVAFSVADLRNQVVAKNPGIEVPSIEWIRLQFWPRNPFSLSSQSYTGRLNIKFMVQSRQVSCNHPDAHYCAAIFKYLREFAIQFGEHTAFVSQDDKHFVKVGEPGNPVAAVDRGRQVVVARDIAMAVSDHDFTKSKIIPSVSLVSEIPEDINQSFYTGQVCVTLKEGIFEPSSCLRHCRELLDVLESTRQHMKPILCLYTDGGPDHRTTYLSVQIALICLFLTLDLDMLVAARTAPHHSFRNPVERIMSLLNIGLQSVGVMRQRMSDEMEKSIQNANSMADVRSAATKTPGLKESFINDSVKPTISLLSEVLGRLSLKGKPFQMMDSPSEADLDTLFDCVHRIDPTVQRTHTEKRHLPSLKGLAAFLEHCCQTRHYFFAIRKCGKSDCNICKPPRLPTEVFQTLHRFPDPVPESDTDSYQDFQTIYGKTTSEKFLPSQINKKATAPFRLSGETVRNIVICGECLRPRCVYARKLLSKEHLTQLEVFKEDNIFVCGSNFIPPESELSVTCFVESGINCDTDVNPHYFSSRLNLQKCCYICASLASLVDIPDEKARSFQSIHPVCTACRDSGKSERTRGKRSVGQKRKAPSS